MKKVKVVRLKKMNGDTFFQVYVDGVYDRCFYFTPQTEEMEQQNAMEYAARVEKGETDIEETIYETILPDQPQPQ